MSTREELLGAEVLELVDHLHLRPHEHRRHRRHHPLRKAAMTALEALALVSLAHRLDPSRARRFASVATAAYLKHRVDTHHPRHHR